MWRGLRSVQRTRLREYMAWAPCPIIAGASDNFFRRRSPRYGGILSFSSAPSLPDSADVVVVGGGIIGSSVAYHLANDDGCKRDVLLLERDQLTSGTTWHAAGLMVTYGSTSETSTEFRKYTRDLYSRLEEETGQSTGFKQCGFIELATNSDRLEEYRRVSAFNRKCGVNVKEISAAEVKSLFPLCNTDDVLAGFYVAEDGRVNPVDATMALAKGARMGGAKIIEGVTVTGITKDTKSGAVTGVTTDRGTVKAQQVINCGGMWARQFGALCGVSIPNQAAEHYYLVTDDMPEVDPDWPVVEDPSSYTYIRPEGGGLLVGLFEPRAAAWNVEGIPSSFSFGEIEADWDRMGGYLETAMKRVPATLQTGAKHFFCGPESFTPDLNPILGEAPEVPNYFVAAGMNSIGILTGGGVGRLMAHWMNYGFPDMDVTGMNVDRFHPFQCTEKYRSHRVVESLGLVYKCHYPTRQMETARMAKTSPFHSQLQAEGASFRDVSGWEAPDWFARPSEGMNVSDPKFSKLGFNKLAWFPIWEAEHRACREAVIAMDMSFMSKFTVEGEDAGKLLNALSTANVDQDVDTIHYTQWLNVRGNLEADLTVMKLSPEKFVVIATDTMHRHVETWMRRHATEMGLSNVFIRDVTAQLCQLNIQGPNSRALLQRVVGSQCNMSDDAFPFRGVRQLEIGYACLRAARITYCGELGYELYIPVEQASHVLDCITTAVRQDDGNKLGFRFAGLKALSSLRLEKGYRDYGHDMDNTDTIHQVGLSFTCDFEKLGGFIGREAVLEERKQLRDRFGVAVPSQRLLNVVVRDPNPLLHHAEVIYRNGKVVGDVRSGSYGHTLGGSVGLAMVEREGRDGPVDRQYVREGEWEVDIAGVRYPLTASILPLYDPKNKAIKG